jgi:hypothetical protein
MNVFKFILDFIMKLFATKTEEISVDASEIQEQLNNLSIKTTPKHKHFKFRSFCNGRYDRYSS